MCAGAFRIRKQVETRISVFVIRRDWPIRASTLRVTLTAVFVAWDEEFEIDGGSRCSPFIRVGTEKKTRIIINIFPFRRSIGEVSHYSAKNNQDENLSSCGPERVLFLLTLKLIEKINLLGCFDRAVPSAVALAVLNGSEARTCYSVDCWRATISIVFVWPKSTEYWLVIENVHASREQSECWKSRLNSMGWERRPQHQR